MVKEIYYCPDEKEFYFVRQTAKRIYIDWIENKLYEFSFDMNVRWKKLVIDKTKDNYSIKDNSILLFPKKSGWTGLIFCLVKATKKIIQDKIDECNKYNVYNNYYVKLFKLLSYNNRITISKRKDSEIYIEKNSIMYDFKE